MTTSPTPSPASLFKRIGEAADGYKDGKELWIVAELAFPHNCEIFREKILAEDFIRGNEETHRLFGPIITNSENDSVRSKVTVSEVVIKYTENGDNKEAIFDGNQYDCVFWSEEAFDKFLVPYYTRLYGIDFTNDMRRKITGSPFKYGGHCRKTTWIGGADL